MSDYAKIARDSRIKCLELIHKAGTSHIGSVLGCADILAVLFEKIDFEKDVFLAGKSWAASLVYYHLWRKGRITEEELNSYCIGDSKFIGLLEPTGDPLIPFGIGSMGTCLPAAVGFALSKKLKGEEGKVYILMSDGELQCGTTWESARIATQHGLNNLVVIIDNNGFQAMGETKDILNAGFPSADANGGWIVEAIDGHNHAKIDGALGRLQFNRPKLIDAQTIKGRGVSFMEGENLWHYAQVKEDDYKKALTELNA